LNFQYEPEIQWFFFLKQKKITKNEKNPKVFAK